MRRLDLPGWAGVTCLLIGSSLALDDRFVQAASPDFDLENLLDGKPQLRLYSNLYNTDDVDKPGKFSRDSVEAAPDSLKLPTFSKHASLPYLRSENVGPFNRQFVEAGSLKYYGGAAPGGYSPASYSNVDALKNIQRYTLENPAADLEFPSSLGQDGFTYYGAATHLNANPFLYARSMLEEAKARVPVGEVKKPLRADVERRVYVPEPLNMYASSSRLFQKSLSEHKTQFESLHDREFLSARANPGHKAGHHYHELSQPLIKSSPKDFKIVCYYEAWAVYRKAPFNFGVSDIDPFACTHIIYSFAGLDNKTLTIVSLDKEEDIVKGSYKSAVGLKQVNPSLKIMLAIGGWNEGGKKYSDMASSKQSRAAFIASVVAMMEEHGFDGFDLDWEYPGATDRDGKWADKKNFADLVEELSEEFAPRGWLLSAAVSPASFRVEEGYDVARIARKLDFINVMTYDLHGSWDNFADHHSPLHTREHDSWEFQSLNTEKGLALWKAKGAPLEKLMLGTPFYGRSFTLKDASKNKPGARIKGPGPGGEYTEEPGYLAYFEICQMLAEGEWTEAKDSDNNPYIVKGDHWIGYDDINAIKRKMHFVRKAGLGGAMIWAMDLDDYKGVCGTKAPLLTNMNLILRPKGGVVAETDVEVVADLTTDTQGGSNDYDYDSGNWEDTGENDWDTGATDVEDNFVCTGQGQFASPDRCDVFYTCTQDGKAHRFTCADGLLFDSKQGTCNWPELVTCASIPTPTLYKDKICGLLSDGVYTDPVLANQFFHCNAGRRVQMSCPIGLYFDALTATCTNVQFVRFIPGYILQVGYPGGLVPSGKSQQLTMYNNNEKKVVCYFSNWAGMRDGDGKFVPENIPASKCTHVVYAFAKLDENAMSPAPSGPLADINDDYYARVIKTVRQGNPAAKVLIAMGGWADSAGDKYSKLVNSPANVDKFVSNTQKFLKVHGFDGIVMEWHFPVCWQSDCAKGPDSDRAAFTRLLASLKKSLGNGYQVGATLAGYEAVINKAYDVSTLSNNLDFLTIMAYDMHGFWDGETNHHAPLQAANGPSVERILNTYVSKGADKAKLIVGIPFYGQSFTTRGNPGGVGHPTSGPGEAGQWTKQPGMLGYNEICLKIRNAGWSVQEVGGAYAFNNADQQWVGYDSMQDVAAKARFIQAAGFGGVAVSTLDLDDFANLCCKDTFPLLSTISNVILGTPAPVMGCRRPAPPVTPAPKPASQTDPWDDGSSNKWSQAAQDQGQESTSWTTPSTTSTTTTTTTTTTTKTTAENLGGQGECEEGQYYRHPASCQKYYRCLNGVKVLHSCAGGLAWDQLALTCDWEDNVKCHRRSIFNHEDEAIIVENNEIESVGIAVISEIARSCSGNEYSSVPGDCSSFYQCVNGAQLKQSCSPGLHFSASKSLCDWPINAGCEGKVYQDGKTVKAACQEGAFQANPNDCGSYLFCVHGKFEKFQCQAGTHWDTKIMSCNHAELAGCTSNGGGDSSNGDSSTGVESVGGGENTDNNNNGNDYDNGQWESGDYDNGQWESGDYEGAWKPSTPKPLKPFTGTTEAAPLQGPLSGDYKVVCYFTNWAWYRPGIGKYKPDDIDPTICTHIVYGFAVLDYSTLLLKPHDSWADIDNDFYGKVTEFKKYGIKVTVAIGGWNDSQGDKYSRLVNNPSARAKFIKHVMDFIHKYNFDGLDLDWEYPSCWQTECKEERYKDKDAFAAWVRELKEAFAPRGYLLSAAVSPSKKIMDVGYDIPSIARDLDWIAVMTYDYHGHWDKKTGHVAPFYEHPEDEYFYFNTNYTINYWIESGAPRNKLVMGMPLYGQAFTLDSASNHGLNAPAGQKGKAGEFTRAAGFLAYYEICADIKQGGWTVVKDPKGLMGPYAYKDRQWVGYDDVETIRRKSEYVREMGLAGGMVWALDLDDFRTTDNKLVDDTTTMIQKVAEPATVEEPEPISEPEPMADPLTQEEAEAAVDPDLTKIVDSDDGYKVVCYFTNWAWYRPGAGKYTPDNIDASLCTHVVYGFAVLHNTEYVIRAHDSWADFDNEFYKKVTSLKSQGKKVLLALGGWNDSAGNKYSKLVNSPENRRKFVEHAVGFLQKHNFDGLDLDWEYPKCWQVDCSKGPDSDKAGFTAWVKELAEAFRPHGFLVTAAVSPSNKVMDAGYDIPMLSKYLDYISVMTYDYHGQWDKMTGHVAPMYKHEDDFNEFFNVDYTVKYWLKGGLDKKKLIMGMPMYGQSFTLASAGANGLNSRTYGGGTAGPFTRARGFLAYYEICDNIQNKGWTVIQDPLGTMGPYAFKGTQWVSFDDVAMIKHKSEYVKKMGLGGAMIWALDLDDFRNTCGCGENPLLSTINSVLRGNKAMPDSCDLVGNYRIGDLELSPRPYATCDKGNFAPVSGDCGAYQVCNNGEYSVQQCPPGLHWNRDRCDWPDNAKCDASSSGELEITVDHVPAPAPAPASEESQVEEELEAAIQEIPASVSDTGKKVVCYFTNWAWYRQGKGKYTPDDIDSKLCTHINYGFAVLHPNKLIMTPHDSWADIDNKFFERVAAFKKKGVKVSIALGGWNDSEGNKYSRLVNSPSARAKFITEAVNFIEKYGFEGLDLDWEYPKCWQVDCDKGPASDKEGFAALIRELSAEFKPRGWLLSAAVSPSKKVIDAGYDVPTMSQYLDIINVMTYDYHGHWDKKTGHVAPMFEHPDDDYNYFNTNYTMNYWVELGAAKDKLVVGMPMYGQSFALKERSNTGLNSPAYGRGEAGEFTRAGGFLAYYEICERVQRQEWTVVQDPQKRMGPYAYKGDQWVGFDDISMIRQKSQWVVDNNFGGGMIWALDLDDFTNACGCEKYPLLRTINRVLRGYSTPDPGCDMVRALPYSIPLMPYTALSQQYFQNMNLFR